MTAVLVGDWHALLRVATYKLSGRAAGEASRGGGPGQSRICGMWRRQW